jgi:ubiquitin carboxyl-terminal hydrolase 36/42
MPKKIACATVRAGEGEHSTAMKRVVGLVNHGNTCYANAVLQVVMLLPPFTALLLSPQDHIQRCNVTGFCALRSMSELACRYNNAQGPSPSVSPGFIVSNIQRLCPSFTTVGHQEDASEFLMYLLDAMQKSVVPKMTKKDNNAVETSSVHRCVRGYFRQQVHCQQGHISIKDEPYMTIPLEVKTRTGFIIESVTQALTHHTQSEEMFGDNEYMCASCERKTPATKDITLYQPPACLIIQLQRFAPGYKLDHDVGFESTLNVTNFVSNNRDTTYKLYGIVVHAGDSCHSGHYFAFVKNSTGSWFRVDDRRVEQVSLDDVLKQQAYMLFYMRDTVDNAGARRDVANAVKPASLNDMLQTLQGMSPKYIKSGGVEVLHRMKSELGCLLGKCVGVYKPIHEVLRLPAF